MSVQFFMQIKDFSQKMEEICDNRTYNIKAKTRIFKYFYIF